MKVVGLINTRVLPLCLISVLKAWRSCEKETPAWSAILSRIKKPMLCRVSSYSAPIFPNPTIRYFTILFLFKVRCIKDISFKRDTLSEKGKASIFTLMSKKLLGLLLIFFLLCGSGCKVIYKNRVPVVQAKKRYSWYHSKYKKRKRTKIVWMKVHKGKNVVQQPKNSTPLEQPLPEGPSE